MSQQEIKTGLLKRKQAEQTARCLKWGGTAQTHKIRPFLSGARSGPGGDPEGFCKGAEVHHPSAD